MPHSAQPTYLSLDSKKDAHSIDKNVAPAIRAYLGGSFDPVHVGHLQMAMYVYQTLLPIAEQQQRMLQVSLLPNARSPFKNESTDPEHRLTMLKLATQNTPLQISELELWQTPPVYTINSVQTLREHYPTDSLIFIMGMDSARSLDKWKDGLQLTNYVNLWIFNRDDRANLVATHQEYFDKQSMKQETAFLQAQLPIKLQRIVADSPSALVARPTQNTIDNMDLKNSIGLKDSYQGRIYIDSRPVIAVSSTQIRQQLAHQMQLTAVQPISAIMSDTASNSSAKWLKPAVYQYIIARELYSAAQFR